MKNKLDKQYTDLLQDILDIGSTKTDRTGTGTLSVFGRQIRHDMKDGFPLLTTKKMPLKTVMVELIWFLRGDTNIKYLLDNNCHIWDGDCYKFYCNHKDTVGPLTEAQFIEEIKTNDEFCKKWGDLGPIYGKQWRDWRVTRQYDVDFKDGTTRRQTMVKPAIDQIRNLINDLKNNPDSRRLMVNAWNVGELDGMTLPPCHYGFQCYTRELTLDERKKLANYDSDFVSPMTVESWDRDNVPTRALSLMWNQRSVDTFLGLPFNIASYGLLLTILAKLTNMVPDQLIGNLGDTHLYLNHLDQAKEQIGYELSLEERQEIFKERGHTIDVWPFHGNWSAEYDNFGIPKRSREPFELPMLNINTEFWLTESGECGVGLLSADGFLEGLKDENFCKSLLNEDIQLVNYKSHPTIKAPLSN